MDDRKFSRELLKNKEVSGMPKHRQIGSLLLGIFSIPMLASGSLEVIAVGSLFLGMAIGSYATSYNWRKRAQESWVFMVEFIDWGKVKNVAEGGDK